MYKIYLLEGYLSYFVDKYGKNADALDDETFIKETKKLGTVYSLKDFEDTFNEGRSDLIDVENQYIRILEEKE